MIDILVLSVVVSFAATIGGIISLYTKIEIRDYKKWIMLSEKILLILISILLITMYQWTILFVFLGLAIPLLKFDKLNLTKYTTLGVALGAMFALNAQASYFIGALISLLLIINASLIGYNTKKRNVFKEIGKYQAIFIIAAIFSYLISITPFVEALLLNSAAGVLIVSALS
jgi:hypothetical protein